MFPNFKTRFFQVRFHLPIFKKQVVRLTFDFIDMSKESWCLNFMYHLKARIYVIINMDNEAIKVLKKLRKIESTSVDYVDRIAIFLIGYLYNKSNNTKEALKWFRKVFTGLEGFQLSTYNVTVKKVFLALYEIAKIKFEQGEYQIAELILTEFRLNYTDQEHLFNGERDKTLLKIWAPYIGSMTERFKSTEEMLDFISKLDENTRKSGDMPEDIVKVIKTYEENRIGMEVALESNYRNELDLKTEEYLKAKKWDEALTTQAKMYEDMYLEENPQGISFYDEQVLHNKFCNNFIGEFFSSQILYCDFNHI